MQNEDRTTFLEKIFENFSKYPDRIALSDDLNSKGITYSDLDRISGKIYGYLSRMGIGPEDIVMINLPRCAAVFAVCVGVWRAGAAFTICEDGYPQEKIDYIYKDCNCKLKITMELAPEVLKEPYKSGYVHCDEHTAAYVGYTSGTTGNPKGIVHEIGTLINNRKSHNYDGKEMFRCDDVLGLIAPLNFAAAVMQMNPVLSAGAEIAVAPYEFAKNPDKLQLYFNAKNVTIGFLTPSLVQIFKVLPESVRMLFLSSEPACNIYFDNVEVYNMYAQTETGCVCAAFKVDKPYPITPIGKSQIKELDLKVLNDNNEVCKPGEMGELCLENKFFREYLNLPEMTANAKRGGIYHTGDIGKYLEDGNIVLLGRNDDMVKINGNRVEPAEVEKVVKEVLKVNWAAAKAIKTEKRIYICAYYNEELKVDIDEAKSQIAQKLPSYMVPAYYMYIEKIPMNANGKFSRKDLPVPDEKSYTNKKYEAPQNDTQKLIVETFMKVLHLEKVGIDDDFYELGGDSVSSMEAVSLLSQLNISVPDIFKGRTARNIADALSENKPYLYSDAENDAAIKKEHRLTPFQQHMFDSQLYTPNSTMLNLPIFFKTRRRVDNSKMIDALKAVMEAHPALKTRLKINEDCEIVQYYDESEPVIEVEEVTEAEMIDIREHLVQPFVLLNSPLFRCRFFKTERNQYLFLDIHHIISDGTSMRILIHDIGKAYNQNELKKDFYYVVLEEKEKINTTKQYLEDKKYYQSRYNNTKWTSRPDTDFEDRNNRFFSIQADIPLDEVDYTELFDKYGIGANGLFIAITLMTQAKMCSARDVLITWTYNGRDELNKQNIIGNMLYDLPVGISIKPGMMVEEFMDQVKEQVSNGFAHTAYPYTFIENDRIGLTDKTCFLYQQNIFNIEEIIQKDVKILEVANAYASAENLFNVEVIDNGDGKTLSVEYESTRYKEETMQSFRMNFQKIAAKLMQYADCNDIVIEDILR